MTTAAIILAAGLSRRFVAAGGRGGKLLEDWGGQPMIRRSVAAALAAGPSPVIVVTGHGRAAVEEALRGLPVNFAFNANHAEGMGRSLAVGAARLPDDCPAVAVGLADMPRLTESEWRTVLAWHEAAAPGSIVVPVRAGRRGHPVVFAGCHIAALRALTGDRGARSILERQGDCVVECPVETEGYFFDVDLPDDLGRDGG